VTALPAGSDERAGPPGAPTDELHRLLEDGDALDIAVYDTVARTATPTLDGPMIWISDAATDAKLWSALAAVLALVGGGRGRRAAVRGMAALLSASVIANLVAKPAFARRRPARPVRAAHGETRIPASSSFPSGHTASAFAFATAVGAELPALSLPLNALAAAVGYSRVHLGVHYPSDVIGGAVLGMGVGTVVRALGLAMRTSTPGPDTREHAVA
jgi:membrane-associated phospholipid phosphatase